MKHIRGLLAAAFVLAALLSCSEPEAKKDGAAVPKGPISVKDIPGTVKMTKPVVWEVGKSGGTWQDTYAEEPKSYNPFSNLDGTHTVVSGLMLDYLFDYDPDKREWSGWLIDTFEVKVDPEKNTMDLVCKLKDDVFWSDGVQMTADDMIFWYDEIEGDPEIYPVGSQGQFVRMDDGSAKRILIEKIDKLGFRYRFPRVVQNPVLMVNTGSIVPRHIWEPVKKVSKKAVMDFWGINTPPDKLVGNGPFLLEKNVPGERLIFKKNPKYWMKDAKGNRLPYLDKIVLTLTPDPNAELLKFQKGEIDGYALRGKDLATLVPEAKSKGFTVWNGGPADGYPALVFNQNPKAVSKEKARTLHESLFPAGRELPRGPGDHHQPDHQRPRGAALPYHLRVQPLLRPGPDFALLLQPGKSEGPPRGRRLQGHGRGRHPGGQEREEARLRHHDPRPGHGDPRLPQHHHHRPPQGRDQGHPPGGRLQRGRPEAPQHPRLGLLARRVSVSRPSPSSGTISGGPTGTSTTGIRSRPAPRRNGRRRWTACTRKLIYTYDEAKVKELYSEFQKTLMDAMVIIPLHRKYSFNAVYDKWGNVNWDVRHSLGDGYRRIYLK